MDNYIKSIFTASLFSSYFCPPKVDIFYFLVSLKRKGGDRRGGGETYLFDGFWYLILMLKKYRLLPVSQKLKSLNFQVTSHYKNKNI